MKINKYTKKFHCNFRNFVSFKIYKGRLRELKKFFRLFFRISTSMILVIEKVNFLTEQLSQTLY